MPSMITGFFPVRKVALTFLGAALPPALGGFHFPVCFFPAHQNGDKFGLEI